MSFRHILIALLALFVFTAPIARADSDMPVLNTQNFAPTLKSADHLVLIEFKARWCPYCKKQQPFIDELRASHASSLDVYQVDVEDDPDIASDYDAHVLPTLIVFWHGNVVGKSEGALYGSDLTDWIHDIEQDIKSRHKSVESDSPQPL